jgi:hypothetical protein
MIDNDIIPKYGKIAVRALSRFMDFYPTNPVSGRD